MSELIADRRQKERRTGPDPRAEHGARLTALRERADQVMHDLSNVSSASPITTADAVTITDAIILITQLTKELR